METPKCLSIPDATDQTGKSINNKFLPQSVTAN